MLDVRNILGQLALERQLFHSEADFQHAFAWKVHELYSDAKIRLEVPSGRFDKRERIDILIKIGNHNYAVELKYKKKKLELDQDGEKFALRGDDAHDVSRYDFIKDISRLEKYVSSIDAATGYAVLLTNDSLYWKESARGVNSAAFFLHEGRVLDCSGPLAWHDRTGHGTKVGREESLVLHRNYTVSWRDYSIIQDLTDGKFRYIVLAITR